MKPPFTLHLGDCLEVLRTFSDNSIDAIDHKIELHRKKRAVLEDLFKALLHKLMTGEIRVADLDLSALEPLHTPHVAA